jgi:hypothetical protein
VRVNNHLIEVISTHRKIGHSTSITQERRVSRHLLSPWAIGRRECRAVGRRRALRRGEEAMADRQRRRGTWGREGATEGRKNRIEGVSCVTDGIGG